MIADVVLVVLLSADTFFACLALCAGGVALPALSAAVLSGVGTLFLSLSLLLGSLLHRFLPAALFRYGGAAVLALLGLRCLRPDEGRALQADRDGSRTLSAGEALLLALPLSADSLLTGLCLSPGRAALLLPLSLLCGLSAALAGRAMGRRLASREAAPGGQRLAGALLLTLAAAKALL